MTEFAEEIIKKHYSEGSVAYNYLYHHSLSVTLLALKIADHNSGYTIDRELLANSAMLHDIGIILTHAPGIGCYGENEYIKHGFLGRELLEEEGLNEIAPVCERHVGVGFTLQEIINSNLPLPHREMLPLTIEEKIVCYADKFYSKKPSYLKTPKPMEKIRRKISGYGKDKINMFEAFVEQFGYRYIY